MTKIIWWMDVCGNQTEHDAFWSSDLTIHTHSPDLTQCFQKTVLSWTPCALLWLSCLVYVPYLQGRDTVNGLRRTSFFNWYKVLTCVILCLLSISCLVHMLVEKSTSNKHLVDFIQPSVFCVTYLLAGFVTHYEFRKGVHSGGVLFCYWGLSAVLGAIPARSYILHMVHHSYFDDPWRDARFEIVSFYVCYVLTLCMFICQLVSDLSALPESRTHSDVSQPITHTESQPLLREDSPSSSIQLKPNPILSASFWKRLTLFWNTGFIIKGYKRSIEFRDLWDLLPDDKSGFISENVSKKWDCQVKKLKYSMTEGKTHDESCNNDNNYHQISNNEPMTTGLIQQEDDPVSLVPKDSRKQGGCLCCNPNPSIWTVIVKEFGAFYMIPGLFLLLRCLLDFVSPQLLGLLITFIGNKDPYAWHGYMLVVLLLVNSVTTSMFNQNYWLHIKYTGMRVRTAVIGMIYRKALKLNNSSRNQSTTGEIVNLMSVDARMLQSITNYLHIIWQTPLTVGLAMYFLWQELGPSVLAGLGLTILFVPFNAFIAEKSRLLQIKQMAYKDQRLKSMNELLNGIKILKLYAWEDPFADRLIEIREKELDMIKKAQYYSAGIHVSWNLAPYIVALGSFATYTLSSPDHVLDAKKAFVSLALFNLMNYPLSSIPDIILMCLQCHVSIGRINKFLRSPELDPDNVAEVVTSENALTVQNGSFCWNRGEGWSLRGIDLSVPQGSLVAVVGAVGSGKSSLISALLGEMEVLSGKVTVKGSIGYIPQQAWIQNDTLQNNILFAREMNQELYNQVLDSCALEPDLQIFPGGDQVEIGENGINLSGGQKQRVSLARAVYQDLDIYLLDDPLSAVDAHVGKHIFYNVIGENGILKNKTRVLVTNAVTFLPKTDLIVCLKDGRVSEMGTYNQLINNAGAFSDFISVYHKETDDTDSSEGSNDQDNEEPKPDKISSASSKDVKTTAEARAHSEKCVDDEIKADTKLTAEEAVMHGRMKIPLLKAWIESCVVLPFILTLLFHYHDINMAVMKKGTWQKMKFPLFKAWIKSCGVLPSTLTLLFYVVCLCAQAGANIWLSEWSNDQPTSNGTQNIELRNMRLGVYGGFGCIQGNNRMLALANIWLSEWSNDQPTSNGTQDIGLRNIRLGVYGGFGCIQAITLLGMCIAMAIATVSSSRVHHHELLHSIIRAPMSFYDTTPMGRIVNRFSKDLDAFDNNIPITIRIWMGTFAGTATTFFVVSYSTPVFLAALVPMAVFYFCVQRFFVSTSRQVKRIESVKRSPIYSHFRESLSGISSVRSYKHQQRFIEKSDNLVDENQIAMYPNIIANRWLGVTLDLIGNATVFFAGLFAVLQREHISPGIAGLSITYALQITGNLSVWVRMTSEMEKYIVAIERIQEYIDCPKEAPNIIKSSQPDPNWPSEGAVQFHMYGTRYRPGLELVLKHVTCKVLPGEKLGVVGRTGAGKSSMSLALFRIIEPVTGSIRIDGVDISEIGLHDLRSKITIIPQDPVLFSGTIRLNLDPYSQYTDSDLWRALGQAHLRSYVQGLVSGLMTECSEGGQNLSVGQRQQVCLARALLRRTKILILDEATAAVDLETDDLIQETIRSEFKDSTVITVAHRINTVMDYDRILVLHEGEVVELDRPQHLCEDNQSMFYRLAANAGLL